MKRIAGTAWLRIPSIIGILLMALPLLNLLCAALNGTFPASAALAGMFFIALSALAGDGLFRVLGGRKLAGRALYLAGMAAMGLGTAWAIHAADLPLPAIPAGVLACAGFLLGGQISQRGYADILHRGIFLAFQIELVIAAAVLWVMFNAGWSEGYDLSHLTAAFLIETGCYSIVCNQANIDSMLERRRYRSGDLPPSIRINNLLLTCGAFGALLLCFLLRGPVMNGIRALLRGIRAVIAGTVRFLLWLISLIRFASVGEALVPEETAPFGPAGGGNTEWIDQMLKYAGFAATVFLLIFFRRQIRDSLRRLLARAAGLMRWLAERLFGLSPPERETVQVSPYYRDTVQTISRGLGRSPVSGMRRWRAGLRRFKQMPEGAEKLRFGYRLTLEWLRMRGKAAPADTVAEIAQAAGPLMPEETGKIYERICAGYERVRYGEYDPAPGETALIEEVLMKISALPHPKN